MDVKIINKIIGKKNINAFDVDLKKDFLYMNSLPNPKSLLDRSYLQYKCQAFQKGWALICVHNFIAFFSIIPITIYLLSRKKTKEKKQKKRINNAVFIYGGIKNIIPKSVKQEFEEINEVIFAEDYYLRFKDVKEMTNLIFHFFFSPYFIFMLIYKTAIYRYLIDAYSPNAIICTSEYSFTSSYLTQYCQNYKVEHINVMHGEKALFIRDSFFQFNRCYVWDKHYVNIFKKLRVEQSQFKIENPHKKSSKINKNKQCKYVLAYYLSGDEGEDELTTIKNTLKQTQVSLEKINIRPHPVYSNIELVQKVFKQCNIELASEVAIENSIEQAEFIISLYSTVLYQAYLLGKITVIDDLSNAPAYSKLQQLEFIMSDKANFKLSELAKAINK